MCCRITELREELSSMIRFDSEIVKLTIEPTWANNGVFLQQLCNWSQGCLSNSKCLFSNPLWAEQDYQRQWPWEGQQCGAYVVGAFGREVIWRWRCSWGERCSTIWLCACPTIRRWYQYSSPGVFRSQQTGMTIIPFQVALFLIVLSLIWWSLSYITFCKTVSGLHNCN